MHQSNVFQRPLIAYDGSPSCHQLLTVFASMHPHFENSNFMFVWDPRKNYIPPTARGPGIQVEIKEKTEGLSNISIKLVERTSDSQQTTNEYILEEVLKSKSTFLMLGFYGSKGQKVRSKDLSSRVRTFVYDSKIPVAVIKTQHKQTHCAVFCCDGSEISYEGLKKAIGFCRKFGYSLSVVHIYSNDLKTYSKQVRGELKIVQEATKDIKIDVIVENGNLIQYLEERAKDLDWILITKNGYRGEISKKVFIGSNTTEILTKINANLIIL